MVIEKLIEDDKVAILVSPGFGAGWSTWADESIRDFVMFDRRIVEAAMRNASADEAEALVKELTGTDYIYMGGWDDIRVRWVDVGTTFYINEYDGSESLRFPGDGFDNWKTA